MPFVWWYTNLVYRWGSDGVSQQLAVEWAINTFIHVVQELCIFIVLTCVNILTTMSKIYNLLSAISRTAFVFDYATPTYEKAILCFLSAAISTYQFQAVETKVV